MFLFHFVQLNWVLENDVTFLLPFAMNVGFFYPMKMNVGQTTTLLQSQGICSPVALETGVIVNILCDFGVNM